MVGEMVEEQAEERSPCPACGGSGQLNFFKGESRFLLSVEECPACCGFGYVQEDAVGEKKNRSERKG